MKVKRFLFFASLCFVFSLFPFGSAFAYDGVVAGPLNGSSGNQVYVVNAHSRYDATEYLLGLDYSSLTADQRAYLSNESTGGAFYQFVHSFQPLQFPNYPDGFLEATYYTGLIAVYGSASLFWIETNAVERAAAIASYTAIINGDISGGGGGGQSGSYDLTLYPATVSNYALVSFKQDNINYYFSTTKGSWDTTGVLLPAQSQLVVSTELNSLIQEKIADGYTLLVRCYNSNTSLVTNIYLYSENAQITYTTGTNGPDSYRIMNISGPYYYTSTIYSDWDVSTSKVDASSYTGGLNYDTYATVKEYACYLNYGDSSGTPTVPPSNWPEPEPTPTPEPPELPTPPSNPTVPIEPEPPTYPSPIIVGGTTQSVDIQGILDAMDEHCQHLQSAIATGFSNYYTKITTYLRQLFDWLRQVLQGMMDDWTDYFDDALHWLADQFDFTFTGSDYDDSSILFWLKRIWLKLGNGNSSRPVDPVTDPFGIGEWLNQLLQNLVLDLLALGANGLADIVESFRELITKFPFCIPWDIAAMLALLVSEPVAPSVDVPAYTVTTNGLQQVGTYHIDLEDYDESMEGVRAMETLVFAFWLAFKTDFFKGVLSMGGDKQ